MQCVCVYDFFSAALQSRSRSIAHSVIDITWMRFVCNVHAFCVLTQTSACNNYYFFALFPLFYLLLVFANFSLSNKHVEMLEICRLCIQIEIVRHERCRCCIRLHSLSAFPFTVVKWVRCIPHKWLCWNDDWYFKMWGKFVLKIIQNMLDILKPNLESK